MPDKRLRVAELAAALSVVGDLSHGLEDGQGIRACVLAMHIADRLDLAPDDRVTLFWVSLLRYAGWTVRASETAAALGDELAVGAAIATTDFSDRPALLASAVGAVGRNPRRVAEFARTAPAVIAEHNAASSEVSQIAAARLRLPARVVGALGQVFQRWDGTGEPNQPSGADIDLAVRVWQVAQVADLVAAARGTDAVRAALRRRSSRSLDPAIARQVADAIHDLPLGTAVPGIAELLALEPQPHRLTDQSGVDDVLVLFGLVADFKAPFLLGHSDRVARLAAAAAVAAGRPAHDVTLLRRAGWVHDIGRVAVSSALWTAQRSLTEVELGQLRAHPDHTTRALSHTPGLAALATIASAHHERLDGSGYPHNLSGPAFTPLAAVLAAADAYVSAGEPRPQRPARPPDEQAYLILGLARDGLLPHDAVDAVIAAVNHGALSTSGPTAG